MAERINEQEPKEVLGAPPEFHGTGIVCLIDLLGFSNWALPRWTGELGHNHPLTVLRRIRHRSAAEPIRFIPADLPFVYDVKHHVLGDTIVISCGVTEDSPRDHVMWATLAVVGAATTACRVAALEGFGTRGGLELGTVFWSSSEVIGPALIRAYHIESRIADDVRVVVGRDATTMFRETGLLTTPGSWLGGAFEVSPPDGLLAINPGVAFGNETASRLLQLQRDCKLHKHRKKFDWAVRRTASDMDIRLTNEDLDNVIRRWGELE